MKNKTRRWNVIILCCIIVVVFSTSAFAEESNVISTKIYYEVLNSDGHRLELLLEEPTMSEIKSFASLGEVYVVKTIETIRQLRMDLSKTVEKTYTRHLSSISGNITLDPDYNTGGNVTYKLRASITYDPNTYKITSATRIIRTYIWWSGWENEMSPFTVNEISDDPVIAPNRYSASFSHSMGIKAYYRLDGCIIGTFNYGTLYQTFTIQP